MRRLAIFLVLVLAHGSPGKGAELGPDLVVINPVQNTAQPYPGDIVSFVVTVKNQGNLPSGDVYILFSAGTASQSVLVRALLPGEEKDVSWDFRSDHIATQQSLRLVATIDHDNRLVELNENNNSAFHDFFVEFPDLVIEDVTWSPTNPAEGDQVLFTAVLKNIGRHEWREAAGKMADVELRIDGKTLVDWGIQPSSAYIASDLGAEVTPNPFPSGATALIVGWGIWTKDSVARTISVDADSANHVQEVTRDNNIFSKTLP